MVESDSTEDSELVERPSGASQRRAVAGVHCAEQGRQAAATLGTETIPMTYALVFVFPGETSKHEKNVKPILESAWKNHGPSHRGVRAAWAPSIDIGVKRLARIFEISEEDAPKLAKPRTNGASGTTTAPRKSDATGTPEHVVEKRP